MMADPPSPTLNLLYIKAAKCHELLTKSIETFQAYMQECCAPNSPEYYRARNFFKEGQALFDEALKEAKKLLGPVPDYVTEETQRMKMKVLEESQIIVTAQTLEELKEEISADEHLKGWMTEDEIAEYLASRFESQQMGKRKLANIKVRMMLDKLASLLDQAQEIHKEAQLKQQAQPV